MHTRRLSSLLLGAWLAGSLFMWMVATQNFRSVDRLLESPSPQASAQFDKLGRDGARTLLRYHVGEQNRWYFETWELAQFAVGALLIAAQLFGPARDRIVLAMAALMFAAVLVEHWYLTPEIVRLGRLMDFAAPGQIAAERSHFWTLHGAYSGIEVLKLVLGIALAAKLVVRSRRRRTKDEAEG